VSAVISRRTWSVFGFIVALFAVAAFLMASGILGEVPTLWVSDFGSFAVQAVCAAAILATAASYGRGERVALPWWLIGIGVGAYALGDLAWAYIEVIQKAEPWPSVADLFYGGEYLFMCAGIVVAAMAYRHLSDWKVPFAVSAVASGAVAVGLYVAVLGPQVVASDMTTLEKVVSAGYPLADALLLLGPAVFVSLLLRRLGTGRLAWPWWAVVAGTLLLAASDAVYSVLSALGTYESGGFIDYGWMAASVLIAFGALIARDVSRA